MSVNSEVAGWIEIAQQDHISVAEKMSSLDMDERDLTISKTYKTDHTWVYVVTMMLWNTDGVYASKALQEVLTHLNVLNYSLTLRSRFVLGPRPSILETCT